jgi:hypothetical protein
MKRSFKISLFGMGIVAILVIAGLYALFHGYFDHGQFEIKQSQRSSANQVAMIAERSDHEALGGLEYYVLIGDHLFNPAELRHAYYSDAVIFSALSDCMTIRWDGPDRLIIRCDRSTIDMRHIDAQKQRIGNTSIVYENIYVKEQTNSRPK